MDEKKEKTAFKRDMWTGMWHMLVSAPSSQISEAVRSRLKEFPLDTASDQELYDFVNGLGTGPYFHQGEISSFMQKLFHIEPFYKRPE